MLPQNPIQVYPFFTSFITSLCLVRSTAFVCLQQLAKSIVNGLDTGHNRHCANQDTKMEDTKFSLHLFHVKLKNREEEEKNELNFSEYFSIYHEYYVRSFSCFINKHLLLVQKERCFQYHSIITFNWSTINLITFNWTIYRSKVNHKSIGLGHTLICLKFTNLNLHENTLEKALQCYAGKQKGRQKWAIKMAKRRKNWEKNINIAFNYILSGLNLYLNHNRYFYFLG